MNSKADSCNCTFINLPKNTTGSTHNTKLVNLCSDPNGIRTDWNVTKKQGHIVANGKQGTKTYVYTNPGMNALRFKSNSLRSSSVSTEYLHRREPIIDYDNGKNCVQYNIGMTSPCHHPVSTTRHTHYVVNQCCHQCVQSLPPPSHRPTNCSNCQAKYVRDSADCACGLGADSQPLPGDILLKDGVIGQLNTAVTNVVDSSNDHGIGSLLNNLSFMDRQLDTALSPHARASNTNYELSEDLQANEINYMEQCYGGRMRAQRAARIIQSCYRDYRLRVEYARLRSEKCVTHKSDTLSNKLNERVVRNSYRQPVLLSVQPPGLSNSVKRVVLDHGCTQRAASSQLGPYIVTTDSKLQTCVHDDSSFLNRDKNSTHYSTSTVPKLTHLTSSDQQFQLQTSNHSYYIGDSKLTCSNSATLVSGLPKTQLFCQHFIPSKSKIAHSEDSCHECSCNSLNVPHLACFQGSEKKHNLKFGTCECNFRKNNVIVCQPPKLPTRIVNHTLSTPPAGDTLFCHNCETTINRCTTQVEDGVSSPSTHVASSTSCAVYGYSIISPAITQSCKTTTTVTVPCLPVSTIPTLTTVPVVLTPHQSNLLQVNKNVSQLKHPVQYVNATCGNCRHPQLRGSYRVHIHQPYPTHVHYFPKQPSFGHPSSCINRGHNSHEKRHKRAYRIGLNIFNKCSTKGIDFLTKYGFLDRTGETIARFLLNRKGLSRVAIGEYLGSTKDELITTTTKVFMRELDFRGQEVDEALRLLLCCFRTPGESQKIVHLLNEFQAAYVEQNLTRVKSQFRNSDTVMILAYAIVMLHTDMYSPNVRQRCKMTREEFVRNLRGVDDGEDIDRSLLVAIYDRIRDREMSVLPDHTDQVRKIQQHLTGPLKPLNLSIPQRRLVCYCRLYEVPDKNKRDRPGVHQREVFLFNDLLLITKAVQKRRRDAAVAYQVRMCIYLLGVKLAAFDNQYYQNGLELLASDIQTSKMNNYKGSTTNQNDSSVDSNVINGVDNIGISSSGHCRVVATLNTKTASDRMCFMEDLQECILEVTEMDRLRLEAEIVKQNLQTRSQLNHRITDSKTIGHQKPSDNCIISEHTAFHCERANDTVLPTTNTVNTSGDALTKTMSSATRNECHHFQHHQSDCIGGDVRNIQRISGDSGLLVDLDTTQSTAII